MSKFFLILIVISMLAGCVSAQYTRYEDQRLGMFDTLTTVTAYCRSKEEFGRLASSVYDKLDEYHKLYDIYNSYDGLANIKTINDNAGIQPVLCDRRIIELMLFAKEQYYKTGGVVNVAFGPVLRIWHSYREEGILSPEKAALPNIELLKAADKLTSIEDVVIDETENTVFLPYKGMALDVGAVAKGFALEQAWKELEFKDKTPIIISLGGNVKAMGKKPDGKSFRVGIQHPDVSSDTRLYAAVSADNTSVVTSGNYQRYYVVDGKRYHHIIDSRTLMPSDRFASVTIICPDSGQADVLSTALFNLDIEEGKALIESKDNSYAVWIRADMSVEYSKGAEALISEL